MGRYEYLPHTADIKVRIWGETLEDAFTEAGKAFTDTTIDISKIEKKVVDQIRVEGGDLEELLYNFIEELIIRLDAEGKVYSDFKIKILKDGDKYTLSGYAEGEELDLGRHNPKIHVKAMTYHEMRIEKADNGYIIEFVLDI